MSRLALVSFLGLILAQSSLALDPPSPNLDGNWEITSLIDDGTVVPAAQIKETLAKGGSFTITGQTIQVNKPGSDEKRTLLFTTDMKANPPTIDLAGANKVGSKGIFLLTGDTMLLCLNGPDVVERPTEFGSKAGSHAMLMTLRRNKPQPPATSAVTTTSASVTPQAPVRQTMSDDAVKKMLVGTWGFQDPEEIYYSTFNQDGSYIATRTAKKGLKKLFDGETRSSGTWKVENGVMVLKISASTEKSIQGQIYTYRINSITDREMILLGSEGGVRREWKVSN